MKSPNLFKKLKRIVAIATIIAFSSNPMCFALPSGYTVRNGEVYITQPDGSTMNIKQMGNKAIIDWMRFCIANGQTVNFLQDSNAIILNRVTGGTISEIFGTLNATGRVWLLNPNGIIFGANSSINAAGFLASTLNMTNESFLDGSYIFTKAANGNGYIVNKGEIVAKDGGYVALLSGSVENQGLVQAKLGKVILASGEKMTVQLDSLGMISVAIDKEISSAIAGENGEEVKDAILNKGVINGDGGTVILTASVLKDIFENAVNNDGLIKATTLQNINGEIYLIANDRVKTTGELNAEGGKITVDAQGADFSGTITASDGEYNMNDGDT
ncbi:MAG: filamentous hemagglutinin N-terminal domain-containing protein, partial [Candidatus Omnitrophica bacterium]|nr:filamentous hemagglutinin N-terminal domain-containing protein [Candidatus Omnitrophota bacterium]MDD5489037.1 filamentous hemagglutinin N-terminal domain-containing protein [Candidatus Omnitrophota bacterium]